MTSFNCTKCKDRHERQAFISHASKDKELADLIATACCRVKVAPYLYEFSEDFTASELPASTLGKRVQESSIVFVLLGEKVSRAFWTQAWIGFEIGVSRGIDVGSGNAKWKDGYFSKSVICVQDVRQGQEVSVPWLDALILFDFDPDEGRWNEFEDAIRFLPRDTSQQPTTKVVDYSNREEDEPAFREEFAAGNRFQQTTIGSNVKCENCKSEYSVWLAIQDAIKLGNRFNGIKWFPFRRQAECTIDCPSCDRMVTRVFTQRLSSDIST